LQKKTGRAPAPTDQPLAASAQQLQYQTQHAVPQQQHQPSFQPMQQMSQQAVNDNKLKNILQLLNTHIGEGRKQRAT
jgi:hypothetical protein